MQSVFDTPWKLSNQFFYLAAQPYIRLLFAIYDIPWGRGWRFYGIPVIQKHRQSRMQFGIGLSLRSSIASNPLGPNHPVILCTWQPNAVLKIGDNFAMTGGSICAAEKITIGNNVAVGANCTIVDTDFHPLNSEERHLQPQQATTAPIVIEDDIFIGMNCIILKGVTIERGSVIGAGSVVTRSIPAGVIAAGNPACVIRKI
jgi:acetyltransferase-like isoleucine patch superfamily enzyme